MPSLDLPRSESTVSVSLIDTGARVSNFATSMFLSPLIKPFTRLHDTPAWCFLITHTSEDGLGGKEEKYLFDLSLRKDQENLTEGTRKMIEALNWKVDVEKDVADVLLERGVDLDSIDGIVWSHWHWDHTGDPTRFPASTELIVGPGFKENMMPGFPTNPESGIMDDAWGNGRNLREISFDTGLKIGGFNAVDFFGDGSFYLLDSPGHTIGHLSALARTTSTSFIFLGGDLCHHPGVIRPSDAQPVPAHLSSCCPGEATTPCYTYPEVPDGEGFNHSRALSLESREKLIRFDEDEDVFVIIAHDKSVLGVCDTFPKTIDGWKEKGWNEEVKWKFLGDFAETEKV